MAEENSCSTSTRSSSGSFDSPRSSIPGIGGHGGLVSSSQSDGTPKTRIIAIAVKAHHKMRREPFAYALHHLVEQKNCRVAVICCLSRLQSEMGVDHIIDVETFGGISKKMLETAIRNQINNLGFFLKSFREQLDQKGVQLDIRISAGPKSEDILVQAAKAIQPHWVVLDVAFSGSQQHIQRRLECNLVQMKSNNKIQILQLTTKFLGPIERVEENSEDFSVDCPNPTGASSVGTPAWSSSLRGGTVSSATSKSTSKVFTFCMCFTSKGGEEGPTKETTVLYGDAIPGSQDAYLGKVGNQSMTQEVTVLTSSVANPLFSPGPSRWFNSGNVRNQSMTQEVTMLTSMPSPLSSPGPSQWVNSKTSRRSTRKSGKIVEQELQARMAKQPEEDDFQEYNVQL